MAEEQQIWEQRWHPFRGEWVLFTSHRAGRPWVGDRHSTSSEETPRYDPNCALCPGNARVRGKNPPYTGAYYFENDLPCFSPSSKNHKTSDSLYQTRPASGTAEVICYHPDHSLTFADLELEHATKVVFLWQERFNTLSKREDVDHVLIFENKGSLVGTSNPHPHCQIYAGNMIYGLTARQVETSRTHFEKTGRRLGMEVFEREAKSTRVIANNSHFIACIPWFARYAYEVFILPARPMATLTDVSKEEAGSLAAIIREVAIRYDNLWQMPMPYVMAFHQAPTDGSDYHFFPFHIEFHPPLRKPDTMKYLAGPEIGGGSMTNESNPDVKAAELQAVSNQLYRNLK